jgi:hypothetical protein
MSSLKSSWRSASVRRVVPEFGAEVFEEHHPLGQHTPVVRAQVQCAQGRRIGCPDRAGAGRLFFEHEVVQDRHAAPAVHDEVDLDARAEAHPFEDARVGEHRVRSPAAGAVPLETGTVAVVVDVERLGHGQDRHRRWSWR